MAGGTLTEQQLEEIDRNARAYGYEIGRGKPMTDQLDASPDNPFLDPDWRDKQELSGSG